MAKVMHPVPQSSMLHCQEPRRGDFRSPRPSYRNDSQCRDEVGVRVANHWAPWHNKDDNVRGKSSSVGSDDRWQRSRSPGRPSEYHRDRDYLSRRRYDDDERNRSPSLRSPSCYRRHEPSSSRGSLLADRAPLSARNAEREDYRATIESTEEQYRPAGQAAGLSAALRINTNSYRKNRSMALSSSSSGSSYRVGKPRGPPRRHRSAPASTSTRKSLLVRATAASLEEEIRALFQKSEPEVGEIWGDEREEDDRGYGRSRASSDVSRGDQWHSDSIDAAASGRNWSMQRASDFKRDNLESMSQTNTALVCRRPSDCAYTKMSLAPGTIFSTAHHTICCDWDLQEPDAALDADDPYRTSTAFGVVYSKFRKFVVVRHFELGMLCLPILTHNGLGLEGKNNKSEYVSVRDRDSLEEDSHGESRHGVVVATLNRRPGQKMSAKSVIHLADTVQFRYNTPVTLEGMMPEDDVDKLRELMRSFF